MSADTTYLRKMLKERGKATVYGDGVKEKDKIKAEGRILVVGDVEENAQIMSAKSIIVIGNVKKGAMLGASGAVFVTGKSEGYLRRVKDISEDFVLTVSFGTSLDDDDEETTQDRITVLGLDEPGSEQAVHEAMEWLGTAVPLTAPRSLSRKFGNAAGLAAGATVGALGFVGLKSLGLDVSVDAHTIFNAAADSPIWTLFGAWAGYYISDTHRPKLAPLALRDQSVPRPALPAPLQKLPALPAPEKKNPPGPAPLI